MRRCTGPKISMDKTKLLDKCAASGDERMLLARILDKLEQAQRKNIPACTGFLSQGEQTSAQALVNAAGAAEGCVWTGGYEGAERKLLAFLPDWLEREDFLDDQVPVRFLRCTFRPEFELTHRDFLGSLMGLGLVREKLGDLLVGPEGCDLVVADSAADFLLQSWVNAGRAPLRVEEIAAADLAVQEQKVREIRDTVMSLRLDAIAAAGFGMSRGKAAELITAGRVQANHRDCAKADKLLAEGDIVTARGLGKFEVAQVGGLSRKGRTSLLLKRYE